MISFACPGCGRKIQVRDDLAGKKGKCPQCKEGIVVPATAGVGAQIAGAGIAGTDMATLPPTRAVDAPTLAPSAGARRGDAPTLGPGGQRAVPDALRTNAPPTASAGAAAELFDFLAPAQADDEIGRLGPYRVLKILGAGGMGVVYLAEDPTLQRRVALKVMLPALAVSASNKERFLREARAAAAIEHDHIVPIYQVGEDRGVPYLTMPFLKGETLEDRLQREGRLPIIEVLRIGRETAEGLSAAQERGMIHRDIKPANLWLEGDKGRVKILDFGLARGSSDDSSTLTQQGAIIGTPAYMAPEQAGGRKVDGRADLFSLGCVLYRMATGEQPFKGTDTLTTLMAVASKQPEPVESLNRSVPRSLAALIRRLMRKAAEQRPATAREVVEAIAAIEADPNAAPPDETVIAVEEEKRPAPWRRREEEQADRPGRKYCRHAGGTPVWPWALGGGIALAAVVAVVVLAMRNSGKSVAQGPPDNATPIDLRPPIDMRPPVDTKPPVDVKPPVDTRPPVKVDPPARPADGTTVLQVRDARGRCSTLALSPDGKLLYVGIAADPRPESAGTIYVWDWKAGKLASTMPGHTQPIAALALSPDGTQLASVTGDWRRHTVPGETWLWQLGTEKRPTVLAGHDHPVYQVAFSPDGKWVVTASGDHTAKVWDATSGGLVGTLPLGPDSSASVAFSADGKYLATGGGNHSILAWSARDLRQLGSVPNAHRNWVHSLAFTPDSKSLISGSADGSLGVWNISDGKKLQSMPGHTNQVYNVAVSPKGRWAASASGDGSAKVWEIATGKKVKDFLVDRCDLYGVLFSRDGRTLMVSSAVGRVHLIKLDLPDQE